MLLQVPPTIDTSNMTTLLASLLGIVLIALCILYKERSNQHKESIKIKEEVIKAHKATIDKLSESKKLAEDRLDKEQEYTKQTAVQVTGVLKDNTSALVNLAKSSDKMIEIKPIVEKSNIVIENLEKHQKDVLKNQRDILNNQSLFINNGK